MTKQEFETIIKPLILLDGKQYQFMRSALLGNFKKWNETKKCTIHDIISRFFFDESDNLGVNVNEIVMYIDPKYDDDKYVDIVICDESWNELRIIKTKNGL